MMKQATTRTEESVMAAKIVAVVAPSKMAKIAWMIVKISEERGLIKISQIA